MMFIKHLTVHKEYTGVIDVASSIYFELLKHVHSLLKRKLQLVKQFLMK